MSSEVKLVQAKNKAIQHIRTITKGIRNLKTSDKDLIEEVIKDLKELERKVEPFEEELLSPPLLKPKQIPIDEWLKNIKEKGTTFTQSLN
jgi:hypothetical protein